jgi:hypothetical protein
VVRKLRTYRVAFHGFSKSKAGEEEKDNRLRKCFDMKFRGIVARFILFEGAIAQLKEWK